MPEEDQLIAEFSRIRDEIIQLNGQAFTALTGSLTINFAILSTVFATEAPKFKPAFLPFIALVVLFAGTILLCHKIRMAHRLGLFLQYFVQPRLEGIQWPSVYFQYREVYQQRNSGWYCSLGERFVEVQKLILLFAQLIDIGVIFWLGNNAFLFCAAIILVIQVIACRSIDNYDAVEDTFKAISMAGHSVPSDHQ